MESNQARHHADLELATRAASGSAPDWHEFVLRYSGLILTIVRRYLAGYDDDTQRSAYVDTLEHFYRVGLRRYDGATTLGSWVITVTRSRCFDAVRAAQGRRRLPTWLRRCSALEREVYRLHFVEQLEPAAVLFQCRRHGHDITPPELQQVLERLEASIDPRSRRRMAYEMRTRSVGGVSARLLEYLDHLRIEAEARGEQLQPDAMLIEEQARATLARVLSVLETLPEAQRRALELRYLDDLTPSRIAVRMGLANRHAARTLIGRAVSSLRANMRQLGRSRET